MDSRLTAMPMVFFLGASAGGHSEGFSIAATGQFWIQEGLDVINERTLENILFSIIETDALCVSRHVCRYVLVCKCTQKHTFVQKYKETTNGRQ